MKALETSHFLKQFSIFLFAVVTASCGGGGGDNPDPDVDLDLDLGATPKVTRDNFVAHTSGFYLTSQNIQGIFALRDVLELALLQNAPADRLEQIKTCSQSGDRIAKIHRIPASEEKIHNNDSIDITYRSCAEDTNSKSGNRSLRVSHIQGDYRSDDYSLLTTRLENITQTESIDPEDDGDYKGRINSTWLSSDGGDLLLYSVDIPESQGTDSAREETHEFYNEVTQLLNLPPILNPTYLETPQFRYDPFSFEVVIDTRVESGEVRKYWWEYEINNKEIPEYSFTTKTTRRIVIAERTRLDENGEEENYFIAKQGEFKIRMDGGAKIGIKFNDPESLVAPPPPPLTPGEMPEVIATFDEDGDGVIDVTKHLDYEEFVGAFFTLLIPSL